MLLDASRLVWRASSWPFAGPDKPRGDCRPAAIGKPAWRLEWTFLDVAARRKFGLRGPARRCIRAAMAQLATAAVFCALPVGDPRHGGVVKGFMFQRTRDGQHQHPSHSRRRYCRNQLV